jgi:hypothetical protein
MKIKTYLFLAGWVCLSITSSFAQKKDLPASTFTLGISHDNVFGFYPAAYGSFGVKENLSFTFYSILWTNPSFGSFQSGRDSWLEAGFGLSISLDESKWYLNPTLGLTHGKLLSGGFEGVIGDGIVPGASVFYKDDVLELEAFGCWYKALRKEGPITYDYALYWVLPGFVINRHLAAGLHFEGFNLTRVTKGKAETQYQAVGGYLKFTLENRFAFRLSLGKNFKKNLYPSEFYKLNLSVPFL